jgi:hypothetical protein
MIIRQKGPAVCGASHQREPSALLPGRCRMGAAWRGAVRGRSPTAQTQATERILQPRPAGGRAARVSPALHAAPPRTPCMRALRTCRAAGTTPLSSSGGYSGSSHADGKFTPGFTAPGGVTAAPPRVAMMSRVMARAWRSSWARWSVTPWGWGWGWGWGLGWGRGVNAHDAPMVQTAQGGSAAAGLFGIV